jgi:hypothetical protein
MREHPFLGYSVSEITYVTVFAIFLDLSISNSTIWTCFLTVQGSIIFVKRHHLMYCDFSVGDISLVLDEIFH